MKPLKHDGKMWCGPAAIARLAGLDYGEAQRKVNERLGRPVRVMRCGHVRMILRELGFDVVAVLPGGWMGKRKLHLFLGDYRALVHVTGHFMVSDGYLLMDQAQVTWWADHWAARKRVKSVWRVTERGKA